MPLVHLLFACINWTPTMGTMHPEHRGNTL